MSIKSQTSVVLRFALGLILGGPTMIGQAQEQAKEQAKEMAAPKVDTKEAMPSEPQVKPEALQTQPDASPEVKSDTPKTESEGQNLATPTTPSPDGAPPEGQPTAAQVIKQVKLTEAQITGFIESRPDIAAIAEKIQAAGDEPDEALDEEIDQIAKKHGFASFEDLDAVAVTISLVIAGLDTETDTFTDPYDALKKQIADVEADSTIPEEEKKQLLGHLRDAFAMTPPLEHKENIELVKANRREIEQALE